MKNKDKTKASKKSGAKASAATKEAVAVASNPRLVAAIRSSDEAKLAYKSSLIAVCTIVQEEQLTKAEVVASLMEGRGIEKVTAESQFSRMKGLLLNPEVLEDLKNGIIDLKTARTQTTKKQANPSAEKKKQNLEKRINTNLTALMAAFKEGGMDKASIILTVKAAIKKAGII